jgi:hypothetical protein
MYNLPVYDLTRSKEVVEEKTTYNNIAHHQFMNMTRHCTSKTAPLNYMINQCNRMLKHNTILLQI